ncbi:MAG: glycosyltransferase [Gemmatimonadota bacterium]|nr:glycosyltransferase [Gemmatimonadota bacterium]
MGAPALDAVRLPAPSTLSVLAAPSVSKTASVSTRAALVEEPKPYLYLTVGVLWLMSLIWFHPRLGALMGIAENWYGWLALGFFVVFVEIAWLYGIFNVCILAFAAVYRRQRRMFRGAQRLSGPEPAVAMLYTTCNDFMEDSVESCLQQSYGNFHIYLLDDSSEPMWKARVDAIAKRHPSQITVVRRPDRKGFKAGNLNHGLGEAGIEEPYFVLVDADEVLPRTFLRRLVPRIHGDRACGFIQANHRSNPGRDHPLGKAMGVGIDIHWRWYQPLRNHYGFVMLLGHGAIIRREAWEAVGGFPEIVSEDLGFSLRLREHGWRGFFAEDVICYEDFPETVRAFRVRHMKWTKGTSEFIHREFFNVLRSRRLTWAEKIDVLLPTLNLPLSMAWFLFLIDANLGLTLLFGEWRPMTLALGSFEVVVPTVGLAGAFSTIYSPDFMAITLLTLVAPVLCFVIEMWRTPLALARFLAKSTTVYAGLGPLSFVGVLSYLATRRATFFVTGERAEDMARSRPNSHPDRYSVRGFELFVGLSLIAAGLVFFQPASIGLGAAFALTPVLHRAEWTNPLIRGAVYVPLVLITLGVMLSAGSLVGLQTVFMGYGLHF